MEAPPKDSRLRRLRWLLVAVATCAGVVGAASTPANAATVATFASGALTVVGGYSEALALARASDLIATVPERYTGNLRAGMHSFPLPFSIPEITISLLWHPRLDADPAHRWLRGCVRDVCATVRSRR